MNFSVTLSTPSAMGAFNEQQVCMNYAVSCHQAIFYFDEHYCHYPNSRWITGQYLIRAIPIYFS